MIAVIADDLTGAAEIGGIALRHGLRVVMDTTVRSTVDMDVLVIATDARSKSKEGAKELITEITRRLLTLGPEIIFKKTDSLLRGHVGEELLVQMETSGKLKALLIPANPALDRTIRNGVYYAGHVPLNESSLASAARNKIATSGVLDLLGEPFKAFSHAVSLHDPLPQKGIIIGNTLSEEDLRLWAGKIDADTLPAGSGGFFNAILKSRFTPERQKATDGFIVGKKVIYVCGSAFPLSKASVIQARTSGRYVSYMPDDIFCRDDQKTAIMIRWIDEIVNGLQEEGKVIIAVDHVTCYEIEDLAYQIRGVMASVIEQVMRRIPVDELVIEGGATASSIIEKLNYERFYPEHELAQGVLRMKVQENKNLFLTMKPGSYEWPAAIWNDRI